VHKRDPSDLRLNYPSGVWTAIGAERKEKAKLFEANRLRLKYREAANVPQSSKGVITNNALFYTPKPEGLTPTPK